MSAEKKSPLPSNGNPDLSKMEKEAANMLHLLIGIVKEYDRTRGISIDHAYAARRLVNRVYNRTEDD